jgi:hypothetical protein
MNLFTARCAQVRKAQLAFYAAAEAANADAATDADVDDMVAALGHFNEVRRAAQADFPGLTMDEVKFATCFDSNF